MKRKSIWKRVFASGLAILMLTALCGCDTKSESEHWAEANNALQESAEAAQRELQELQRTLDRLP